MNRYLALIGALLLATLAIGSACLAVPADGIRFTLDTERGGTGKIQVNFRDDRRGQGRSDWSSGLMASELIGLDTSGLRAPGMRPLRFALVREAGRLDCSGNGGSGRANGGCAFTPDARFAQLLTSNGIGRPTRDQALGLMALNVRRQLVEAIGAAHYAATVGQLMSLTAVGADGRYIAGMAQAGYRPASLQTLVEFKTMNITPEWIGGFVRAGRANLPPSDLLQLKAVNVTPQFLADFDRAGYPNLPVHTLVEMKALDITPDLVRSAARQTGAIPSIEQLVEYRMFGGKRHP